MNIGITFGGYCPLHQGHMDLIMKSKKQNDLTYVFVCGYDGESRADEFDLPLLKRYRIIANFLKSDLVRVKMLSDTELGLDESMSDSNWTIWLRAIYDEIIRDGAVPSKDKITWYVSEEEYVRQIMMNPFEFDVKCDLGDRRDNFVSGTLCRTYPLKFWNKITPPF